MPRVEIKHFFIPAALLGLLSTTACSGDDDDSSKTPPTTKCDVSVSPTSNDNESVQNALVGLTDGQTLCLEKGTYHFNKILTLAGVSDVTVHGNGATRDDVVLDFKDQTSGDDAFTVLADGFTIENLTVKDAPGDGVKVTKAERPTFRNVRAFYTDPDLKKHGAYALYPAECNNVLIENCEVEGSTDAAIYLGQSTTGIVRNNKAHDCVIGIEAENSLDVEIYGNEAWNNTTGILVVNLPDLPHKGVQRVSVHDNVSYENNHDNFGDGFAAGIPPGTGMLIMASDSVQAFHNQIRDNGSPGLLLVSWPTFEALDPSFHTDDTLFDQYSESVFIHDNTFTNNGKSPKGSFADLGFTSVPDMIWDGVQDPNPPASKPPADQRRICIQNNGAATFLNLSIHDAPQNADLAPYDCSYPALPAITLPSG